MPSIARSREFVRDESDAGRLQLVAAYTPDRLADMVRSAYGHLRSRGKEPDLPVVDPPPIADEYERVVAAAAAALAELGGVEGKMVERQRERARALRRVPRGVRPGCPGGPDRR